MPAPQRRLAHQLRALGPSPSGGGEPRQRLRLLVCGVDHPHGCGWRESVEASERFEIVGFVVGFGGAITTLEERYKHLPRFADAPSALAGLEFDAALCLMSNAEGEKVVLALTEAGKHTMMEKPGIGSSDAGRKILDASRRTGCTFTMAYSNRYGDCATALRNMVEEGQFGTVISLQNEAFTTDIRLRNPEHYLFDPEQNAMPPGQGGYFSWLGCALPFRFSPSPPHHPQPPPTSIRPRPGPCSAGLAAVS